MLLAQKTWSRLWRLSVSIIREFIRDGRGTRRTTSNMLVCTCIQLRWRWRSIEARETREKHGAGRSQITKRAKGGEEGGGGGCCFSAFCEEQQNRVLGYRGHIVRARDQRERERKREREEERASRRGESTLLASHHLVNSSARCPLRAFARPSVRYRRDTIVSFSFEARSARSCGVPARLKKY